MARIRKIPRVPHSGRNYYLVDANFLARKHIPIGLVPTADQARVRACQAWWAEINTQLDNETARVYIPDICIAEAFKVIANWYYVQKWMRRSAEYKKAKDRLSADIRTDTKTLQTTFRPVRFHDISTNRDIIVSVDRFFEVFMKHGKKCSVPDLIIAATAKYLMEFFDIPRESLHIVTLDKALREGIGKIQELPAAYDPTQAAHAASKVFT